MKKTLCLILALLFAFSALALTACNGTEDETEATTEGAGDATATETVKLGLGTYTKIAKATDADGDANGQAQTTTTIAAVTLDKDGKILSCQIDCADVTVAYTSEGLAIANGEIKTKAELGFGYNMVNYQVSEKEWFEQADIFETLVIGKTIDEVKALVVNGDKGTEDVITAGCTITIAEFALAIEKAVANASDTAATAANTLKLGVYTQQTTKDAEDAAGYQKLETTVFVATVDANGKITAAKTDCVQVQFGFDAEGVSTFDITQEIRSKVELGYDYNMVNYHASTKEWFEQAEIFTSLCVGKTASEVVGMMAEDNYGTTDVKAAGCTILVSGFAKAAAKIA